MSKKAISDSWAAYEAGIFAIAEQTFNDVIQPFCEKRQWEFIAGNGEWWIGPPNGEYIDPEDCPEDAELLEVASLLGMGIPGMSSNDLGSLMPSSES